MKAPKTEIYEVRFNKYKLTNGDVGFSRYTLGVNYTVGLVTLTPVKILLLKERVHVYFEGGTRHVFGYLQDTELYYRSIEETKVVEKEENKTEEE